eukprot:TRINITY_DN4520_c0_g1_i1.p1 TRINITY_DN4520_c0_g1~~TRINITY_DN4520_c0_g1_i1.p1  ORF type:complete len:315 (+),score=65.76 TRINITY_DN4520_c0_g1_i1:67-945(+)
MSTPTTVRIIKTEISDDSEVIPDHSHVNDSFLFGRKKKKIKASKRSTVASPRPSQGLKSDATDPSLRGLPTTDLLLEQTIPKFKKQIGQMPLHVDFPRMFKLMSVSEGDECLWDCALESDIGVYYDFFVLLANKVGNQHDIDTVKEKYHMYLNEDVTVSDIPGALKLFFEELGEESGIIGILKCINQAIIVPAVTILRVTFMTAKINYFEIRGEWKVDINFSDDCITIHHERWERSHPESFKFSWSVIFELSKDCKEILDTDVWISDIKYFTEPTDEDREHLMKFTYHLRKN